MYYQPVSLIHVPSRRAPHIWGDWREWSAGNFLDLDNPKRFDLVQVSSLVRFNREKGPAEVFLGPMSEQTAEGVAKVHAKVLAAEPEVLPKAQDELDKLFATLWVKPSFLHVPHRSDNLTALQRKCEEFLKNASSCLIDWLNDADVDVKIYSGAYKRYFCSQQRMEMLNM